MENKVQQFLNNTFGEVRAFTKDNEIYFNLHDIGFDLGYTKTAKGKLYLRKDLIVNICESLSITGLSLDDNFILITKDIDFENTYIAEDGLYDVCLESKAKNARGFRKWITKDVIPAIRKDGTYISGEEKVATGEISEEEFILKAMTMMQNKIDRLIKENTEMKPKVEYHDNVLQPTTYKKLITTTEIAKDLGMTAQALNKKLNEIRFIFKDKNGIWCLYKDYQHLVPEYADYTINEHGQTLKYTEQGRKYIMNLLQNVDN